MMRAVTQSHVTLHSVHGGSLTSEKSKQWMRTIEDMHNAAKQQAEDKLEEMGELVQVEGPPSKTVVKNQLKRSKRALRGTISEGVANINRLVTQQMNRDQYYEASPLV